MQNQTDILTLVKNINDKIPTFKICDTVRISKYRNICAKGYTPNWSGEVFMIKKLKMLYRGHMLLMILMEKNFLDRFTITNCKNK